jgi:mono/diheme cytochrome c family protein
MQRFLVFTAISIVWTAVAGPVGLAGGNLPSEHEGYRALLDRGYVPADFPESVWRELWTVWPEPLRSQAEKASPAERRAMMLERYGLTERPGEDSELPLQYSPDGKGGWAMNCFACHGGKVAGVVMPGAPNTHIALQTLMDDVRTIKLKKAKKLTHMDFGSLMVPLGTTRGTTNAVIFGVALATYRDYELNFRPDNPPHRMVHHDMDAPPWWNVKRKSHLYADGFAPRSHRSLMQFMMVPQNGPKQFAEAEPYFEKIYDYIMTMEAPKYPYPIDRDLAERGRIAFERNCAECHGTYGPGGEYPNVNVPIDEIGTDRVRYDALGFEAFDFYEKSWFNRKSDAPVNKNPEGYVAPPLDGVWASAPYFHNGAVPTLWEVLNPSERPLVWKRTEDGYDVQKVGLEVERMSTVPPEAATAVEKRYYFDTRKWGKSAAGHTFPDKLAEDEKRAVLEYLKTL